MCGGKTPRIRQVFAGKLISTQGVGTRDTPAFQWSVPMQDMYSRRQIPRGADWTFRACLTASPPPTPKKTRQFHAGPRGSGDHEARAREERLRLLRLHDGQAAAGVACLAVRRPVPQEAEGPQGHVSAAGGCCFSCWPSVLLLGMVVVLVLVLVVVRGLLSVGIGDAAVAVRRAAVVVVWLGWWWWGWCWWSCCCYPDSCRLGDAAAVLHVHYCKWLLLL